MRAVRPLRQVMRSKKYDRIYSLLAKQSTDRSPRVFSTIKDLLCFAAFLGYALDRREPFVQGEALDDIQEQIFSKDEDALRAVLLVGLVHKGSVDIFHPDRTDELVRIFEEYANGGMAILSRWIDEHPTDLHGFEAIIMGLRESKLLPVARDVKSPERREPVF